MICSVKTRHFTGFGQMQMLSFSVYSCMNVCIYLFSFSELAQNKSPFTLPESKSDELYLSHTQLYRV